MQTTYESKAEAWINENLGKEVFTPGLERLSHWLAPFKSEITNRGIKLITIGGTNGKGEVAMTTAFILGQINESYALWTSPHIISVHERFVFNGVKVSDDVLYDELLIYEQHKKTLSYFEYLFLVFVSLALKFQVKNLILEVGLGGRLDAVNCLDADVASVVSISRDHEEILGRGFRKILFEKLPIARSHKPLITAFELKYLQELTASYVEQNQIIWSDLFAQKIVDPSDHFSMRNQKMACQLVTTLYPAKKIPSFTHFPVLKARGETFKRGELEFEFRGSHNLDGMRKLLNYYCSLGLKNKVYFDQIWLAFSKREESDIKAMIKLWKDNPKFYGKIKLCNFNHPKAFQDDAFHDQKLWQEDLKNLKEKQKILITGSYYFVGSVQSFLF